MEELQTTRTIHMEPTSFKDSIRPLFTEIDIAHMKKAFDLSQYEDVKANAQGILSRLMGSTGSVMPPPPSKGGSGPWPPDQIALFKKWIDEGCNP
jgi:hypothetical protein